MPQKSSNIIYDEIHSAIHALLSGHPDECKLFWTSVGLLDEDNNIEWRSHVNHGCCHAPCSDKKPRCKPYAPYAERVPPCLLSRIQDLCEFRKGLDELEKITMKNDSFSMGELSKRFFENDDTKGEHPYISLEEFTDLPWIASKEKVLNKLGLKDLSTQASLAYHDKAGKCMPEGTTAALIPLVRMSSDHIDYIGAIVVCAIMDSSIWQHLPRIKATALSLTSVHAKNIYKMTSDKATNLLIRLFKLLLEHPFQVHLYSAYNNWHTNQDKTKLEKFEFLFQHCGTNWHQHSLPKYLFNYLPNGTEIVGWKNAPSLANINVEKELIPFLKHFGINLELDGNNFGFSWPTSPGLIGLACLIDINNALTDIKKGIKIIKIKLSIDGSNIKFTFISNQDISELENRWLKSYNNKHSGGLTVRTIWERMFADLSFYLYRFDNEVEQKNGHMFRKLFDKIDDPIFRIAFGEREISLIWRLCS